MAKQKTDIKACTNYADAIDGDFAKLGGRGVKKISSKSSTNKAPKSLLKGSSFLGRKHQSLLDYSSESIKDLLQQGLTKPGNLALVSKELASEDANYAQMLEHYSSMYSYKYTIVPMFTPKSIDGNKVKKTAKGLKEAYAKYLSYVEGASLELSFKDIINSIMRDGVVYFATKAIRSSETIATIMLPISHCEIVGRTNFNTNVISLDLKYFDQFTEEEIEAMLKYYPSDVKSKYSTWAAPIKNGGLNRNPEYSVVTLDPTTSTGIMANELGAPPLIGSVLGLRDFKEYQSNELKKNKNALEKILVHKIETYEGELIFSLPEVKELTRAMQAVADNNEGIQVLTTFGTTELLDLTPNAEEEGRALTNAFNQIFGTAGMNHNLFTGNSVESLKTSLRRDASYIWGFMQKIEQFYNLSINKLVRVENYQVRINMLDINTHNETEATDRFLKGAQYGIGVLEAVVALGGKQSQLESKIELEKMLNLNEKLMPLSSAHTSSGDAAKKPKEEADKKNEDKSPSVEDKEQVTKEDK